MIKVNTALPHGARIDPDIMALVTAVVDQINAEMAQVADQITRAQGDRLATLRLVDRLSHRVSELGSLATGQAARLMATLEHVERLSTRCLSDLEAIVTRRDSEDDQMFPLRGLGV